MSTIPRDKVTLLVDGQRFNYWPRLDLDSYLDAFSVLEFSAPFEPEHEMFRKMFRPFSFVPLELLVEDELLFSGRMLGVEPDDSPNATTVVVTGYALPAVLDDCPAPASAMPLQFNKVGLRTIARSIAGAFELDLDFEGDEGAPFPKARLEVQRKVLDFLVELATQRGRVWNNTPDGKLRCWQSVEPGNPVARLVDKQPPVLNIKPAMSPQEYFSEITGYSRARKKRRATKHTERNALLPGVIRPHSFILEDTEKADAETATRAKLARMFADAVGWTIDLGTWRDPQDALWTPNTTIKLHAPKAMIYRETELLVRGVRLHADDASGTAHLNVVLPGVFSGAPPQEFPWVE